MQAWEHQQANPEEEVNGRQEEVGAVGTGVSWEEEVQEEGVQEAGFHEKEDREGA